MCWKCKTFVDILVVFAFHTSKWSVSSSDRGSIKSLKSDIGSRMKRCEMCCDRRWSMPATTTTIHYKTVKPPALLTQAKMWELVVNEGGGLAEDGLYSHLHLAVVYRLRHLSWRQCRCSLHCTARGRSRLMRNETLQFESGRSSAANHNNNNNNKILKPIQHYSTALRTLY